MDFATYDFNRTIKDFDYTKIAVYNMNEILDSDMFREMDSSAIFDYLANKITIVSFSDYLKRYLYQYAEIEEPFNEITDDIYTEIIKWSFEENQAPHSFEPTTRKWSTIVKSFLHANTCSRDQIFLLGFGLGMSVEEVSTFLTKVIQEQDFIFTNPKEVIYWYCFYNQCSYRTAKSLLDYYETTSGKSLPIKYFKSITDSPKVYLNDKKILTEYLDALKSGENIPDINNQQYQVFVSLYERALAAVEFIYRNDENPKMIEKAPGSADIEKILYSGIPVEKNGNLKKVTASCLSSHCQKKRLGRQRLDKLLNQKVAVDRFDIITLLFLIYAITIEPDWPAERYLLYLDEINALLTQCHFMGIYPVHPYESFVLLCILSDEPLSVFNEIWELSYEKV